METANIDLELVSEPTPSRTRSTPIKVERSEDPIQYKVSLQDAFNNAYRHAVIEGHPRCESDGVCYYRKLSERGENDSNKCLIGVSIPDEYYSVELEGCSFRLAVYRLEVLFNPRDYIALSQLQALHDQTAQELYPTVIKRKLENFAKDYNLTIPTS